MFAKPPPPKPTETASTSPVKTALTALSNPYVGAGGAAGFFLLMATVLVLVTGEPKAGVPVVRLSLAHMGDASGPPGWKQALPQDAPVGGPLDEAVVDASASPDGVVDAGPMGGAAVITLPGGGELSGGGAAAPGAPLAQAPIAGLSQPGPGGLLPVIGPDGMTPAQAYARPFTPDGHPRVALIVGGLGLNARATRQAIETLPPEVTLSFVPYADGLQGWIDMARAAGHEVLLEAPMEPKDYPNNDPGPYTLLADGRPEDNQHKLEWLMSRATGYFGVTNYLGSKFVASPLAMSGLTGVLKSRGLAFVDDGSAARTGGGIPRLSADRVVDNQLSADAIEAQLSALETQASRTGRALGSGFAYPVTLETAARWASGLSARGFQLAPASALTARR
ncbi:MAG TPA: divergent polysaccharide deacetylase family protein [Caulobacteraceae bacterium]|nr:divergent polysaccharide deacetylase family protein [Caulobacteraceae bacterium]